jgi:hypothetical protein
MKQDGFIKVSLRFFPAWREANLQLSPTLAHHGAGKGESTDCKANVRSRTFGHKDFFRQTFFSLPLSERNEKRR